MSRTTDLQIVETAGVAVDTDVGTPTILVSQRRAVWRRLLASRFAVIGGSILLLELVIAALGPLIAPYDPLLVDTPIRLQGPSLAHLMGTDDLGRDIFSRVLVGTRFIFIEGTVVLAIAMIAGLPLGALAGYSRAFDVVFTRIAEVLLAYPGVLKALAIVAIVGPGLAGALLAVGISSIAPKAILVRTVVRSLMGNDYVLSARAVGCSDRRILFIHIVPNAASTLIVSGAWTFVGAIFAISGLSFLGLGAQPPTPEWGLMLASGRDLITRAPHVAAFPGLALSITVLALNLVGDGLRDALDPRTTVRRV